MKGLIKILTVITITIIIAQLTIGYNVKGQPLLTKNQENKTIIVDINGNEDFISIKEAIDSASQGDTILLKKGKYPEIIDITKKVNLIGEEKENTIINPTSKENKCAIKIRADGVTIENLTITNQGPGIYTSGIQVFYSDTKIQNCNFHNNPIGIAIWSSGNIIDTCKFWNCDDEGIVLIGTSSSPCENNIIKNCIFYDNCDGIELQYSSNNIISGCHFYNNSHTGIDAIASSNNGNVISNCRISNNRVHGVYLSSSSHNKIYNCRISDNANGDIIQRRGSYNNEIRSSFAQKIRTYFKERLTDFLNNIATRFSNTQLFDDFVNLIDINFN